MGPPGRDLRPGCGSLERTRMCLPHLQGLIYHHHPIPVTSHLTTQWTTSPRPLLCLVSYPEFLPMEFLQRRCLVSRARLCFQMTVQHLWEWHHGKSDGINSSVGTRGWQELRCLVSWLPSKGCWVRPCLWTMFSTLHMAHGGRDGGYSLNSLCVPLYFPDPLGFSHFLPFATSPLMGLLSAQWRRTESESHLGLLSLPYLPYAIYHQVLSRVAPKYISWLIACLMSS